MRRAAWLGLSVSLAFSLAALGGDLLRGGAGGSGPAAANSGGANRTPGLEAARTNANDALRRTTDALKAVQVMQEAARQAAARGPGNAGTNPNQPGVKLPQVPEGLGLGGLQPVATAGSNPDVWRGARLPTQNRVGSKTVVTVRQSDPQALLTWDTFNVGKNTQLDFNQSAGGAEKGSWIAFNKVNDPSGSPSQILGSIIAPGHVYVINRNGIIFGGNSQIQVRTLVGSSLPINDNLIKLGLLNNRDAQFLFSGLSVPGGADGTPAFTPEPPPTATGRYGDVTVQAGARLTSPLSGDGNGGRIMLVGPNVENAGTISTPSGQTILAAGLQVAVAAHASGDPSLRGLDAFVGAVGDYAGTVTNRGLIDAPTGSVLVTGKTIHQRGAIESTTAVDLNGRIDLLASYGAVGNPNFDNTGVGSGGPQFFYQNTGNVDFGPGSVTRILPDYASESAVPGTALPQNSQINLEGLTIRFGPDALLFAPSADVKLRTGIWPYKDADGNRTIFDAAGAAEPRLNAYFSGTTQRFLFNGGQIYLDSTSLLNVAGSIDVAVPLAHSILDLEFRGTEFADSPLQRGGPLRAVPLTVDLRRSGSYGGRYWIGTPLGDATGLAGIIERNVAQLTAKGGTITLQSGGSIVVQQGAVVDVSGGFFQHEGGLVKTTRLLQGGRLVDIADALPDQRYDGIYTGQFTQNFSKWGVSETFTVPWMTGERYEPGYAEGAAGGVLTMTAPSMAIDGELRGLTVQDPRGRALPPEYSKLSLKFAGETTLDTPQALNFVPASPTPPAVTFSRLATARPADPFRLVDGQPVALRDDRVATVTLSPALLEERGFGHLSIENTDGNITVPTGLKLSAPAGGSLTFAAANVTLRSDLSAPGGSLNFTAHNISPAVTASFPLVNPTGAAAPLPNPGRGLFTLSSGATLSTAGLLVDDRPGSPDALAERLAIDGGTISIAAYSADLQAGTTLDVSGGAAVSARGAVSYGKGGSISILTGKDPGQSSSFPPVLGGELSLHSTLAGYSGTTGGSLALRASLIQIGGAPGFANTLWLQPDFFRTGGFTSYALEGIGAATNEFVAPGAPASYAPAISIAPGTVLEPVAESWLAGAGPAATGEIALRRMLRELGQRMPVSLSFTAAGADDPFTTNRIEARGDIVMGRGARITTDPGASVSFKGQTVSIEGSVFAPGGTITLAGANKFPYPADQITGVTVARPTVYLGPQSVLSAAGTSYLLPDAFGRRVGALFSGGTISVAGNIVAAGGSVLDVSGASAVFDLHPSALQNGGPVIVPVTSGINDPLWRLQSVPTLVESNGGTIDLQGGELLVTDAALLGRAGGPTAVGGTLSIFSGRFYPSDAARTSADINLVVTQSGRTLAATNRHAGVGIPVLGATGAPLPGMGYFAANRFQAGGFDSLDLGYKFIEGTPLSFGGNVEFRGPVSITAPGKLRVAGGGIIRADRAVNFTSEYFAVGQAFRPPLHPNDQLVPFTQIDPANPSPQYFAAPTFGPGSVTVHADLIDIGTLSLLNIGRANFIAANGDIRGNGTLSIAGDLVLSAGQIYPTTLSTFNIFAYDHGATAGSVSFLGSDTRDAPLSSGGALNVFASTIVQGGVLRAPFGSITLGWDGTDFDLSDADLDPPINPAVGTALAAPVAKNVVLKAGSQISVAGLLGRDGGELVIPLGISPDGSSWIDPRGVNITLSGAPQKQVSIAGDNVTIAKGSTIDLRGGGDLLAVRWVAGTGGSADLLGSPGGVWSAGNEYQAGDLVTFGGQTWSARVRHSGVQPKISAFWTQVAESYAVIPGYQAEFAPYAPFNTGVNSALLGGDPGYVSNTLKLGDRVYLNAAAGLPAGSYTLLPRRYATLPGAFLVTPSKGAPLGTIALPEGGTYVAGYGFNAFSHAEQTTALRTQYEVAAYDTVQGRAEYAKYSGNNFFSESALLFDLERAQRLPIDAGYLAIQGNLSLRIAGMVETGHPLKGRGAEIDLSSFADIYVVGKGGGAPAGAKVVLNTDLLNSWGAESLVIGGLRHRGAEGTTLEVRTSKLVVDNAGSVLSAPDITLASKVELSFADGAAVVAKGRISQPVDTFLVTGDGALLRTSLDLFPDVVRTGVTASAAPILKVGAGALLGGRSLILDSTSGTQLDPTANLKASALTLGSGQISIVLSNPPGGLVGSEVTPHLVISDQLLEDVQGVDYLTLRSYRTIDIYGAGTFGGSVGLLSMLSAGLRGFDQGAGTATIAAGGVLFSNPSNVAALAAPAVSSGNLEVNAGFVQLGQNNFSILGYDNVALNATRGLLSVGTGAFSVPGNLTVTTPLISATRDWKTAVTAGGDLILTSSGGSGSLAGGALGASFTFTGASLVADTTIRLPSGEIVLIAKTGNLSVGGDLEVAGRSREFYGITRYSDGGNITLTAEQGDITLQAGSSLSVAAPEGGGDAGTIRISAPKGAFAINGATLLGNAGAGATAGSFFLDVETLPSFTDVAAALNSGGFFERRDLRVRLGDIVIANPLGGTNVANTFNVSADSGSIRVTGTIDASGATGGNIALVASRDVVLETTAVLTARGKLFRASGGGGEIRLEAGASVNGTPDLTARVDIQTGSTIDLGVDELVAGDYKTPGSSAFLGEFSGKLHLRAPRTATNDGVGVNEIKGTITGASSIVVEGYEVRDLTATGGLITGFRSTFNAAPGAGTVQKAVFDSAANFLSAANHAAMTSSLLGADAQGLGSLLVIAPGVEIINRNGNLTLGSATSTALGTAANPGDWNLSDFRFGPQSAPGVLTLRASGNVVLLNALSDGFRADPAGTPSGLFLPASTTAQPGTALWLSPLQRLNETLPVNTQSWSFRIAAGADVGAADFRSVQSLASLAPDAGSLKLGKFYDATLVSGSTATTTTAINNRFQVIRTGTGDIDIAAGRDVQLRNQFASIYTAGVRLPDRTTVFAAGDFVAPIVDRDPGNLTHPDQGDLGARQQRYPAQWSLAGGDVTIAAQRNIERITLFGGLEVADSSRQLPNNWLYRRGYVGTDGLFGAGGVDTVAAGGGPAAVNDPAASTTWWIDFSSFFQSVGALGGGNVTMLAGANISNTDAVIPTNARMPGRDPLTGLNLAPDASRLVELGGGELTVRAGQDIDAGIYYVERGKGTLFAGGEIKTNQTRSPSLGLLKPGGTPEYFDARTWLPTTLFLGNSQFDVSARGDVLIGPATNPFLLPQGINNKFWYKTYFNTMDADAALSVASFGGGVTHRLAATLPGVSTTARPILDVWLDTQNRISTPNASNFQPWIRLAELTVTAFTTLDQVSVPTLRSTAFGGDLNVVGPLTLFPSPTGTLELAAAGSIVGLQPTGISTVDGKTVNLWTAASINVSDADPASLAGVATPLAYQALVGRFVNDARQTNTNPFLTTNLRFTETGSFSGADGDFVKKQSLHDQSLLHSGDTSPIRLYASGGGITGLTLFAPKMTEVLAAQDIADVSFYVQHVAATDISFISAGRDIVPYGENAAIRSLAGDFSRGNFIGDPLQTTTSGARTNALAGDLQINGPGVLEVLAGRNLDLGSGANFTNGTGFGVTSIGNFRNPFLPFAGADLIALAGVTGKDRRSAAAGLAESSLDLTEFGDAAENGGKADSEYLQKLQGKRGAEKLSDEQKSIVGLELFFRTLREAGREAATTGAYAAGFAAIDSVFGSAKGRGEVLTRARDIRTSTGGSISIAAPSGGVTMASDIFGNPLTPPGIVTEFGGPVSIFTKGDVEIGQARIFTLRGGDLLIWSSEGNIAAGTAPKTVVTAPPTRVVIDAYTADVKTDLGGLATGGGIGVLAAVKNVQAGDVDLVAPSGFVDAGDAGIRATGNLTIAAVSVLNASNIQVGGSSAGVPTAPPAPAPNLAGATAGNTAAAAQSAAANDLARQSAPREEKEEPPSIITVELLEYDSTPL